jgi:DNA-binding NarL/FixJ family response regulator
MGQRAAARTNRKITVLIVDDHHIFRQGVRVNLELHEDLEIIGEGSTGDQGLEMVRTYQPDVVIMDINLPVMNGIAVTRQLMTEGQPSRVIMLTAYDDIQQMIHAMKAGAAAYCAKEVDPENLVEVIRQVNQGRYVVNNQMFDQVGIDQWIESGVHSIVGEYYGDLPETFSPLSPREMEILQCVTRGQSNKEIARYLRISHQTVKNHMTSILRKLAVADRTQAAVFALRRGWVRLVDTE